MIRNYAEFNGIELNAIFKDINLLNIDENFRSTGISTDSRILEKGNIFVALVGDKFDGHNFIDLAIENGSSCCVVNNDRINEFRNKYPDFSFIIANDTLTALGELAKYHRSRFEFPIIAVGGSNGKTTTKEMIANLLEAKYKVLKTFGNFNNQIGVPLMLLSLSDKYDMAVLELGTNSPGEIYTLSNIVNPTHAIITNIGKEHLEFLLDMDGVELEETYLFASIRSEGFGFINYDDDRLNKYGHILGKFVTYGVHPNSQIKFEYTLNSVLNPTLNVFHENENFIVNLKTSGYTSALNGMAAITVGLHFGLSKDEIIQQMELFKPLESESGYGRMAVTEHNGLILINDTYNANPDSVIAALKNLSMIKSQSKKVVILGDMKELGDAAESEHLDILKYAVENSDLILLVGEEYRKASNLIINDKIIYFENNNKINEFIDRKLKLDEIILVKGSRSMKMETIINHIKGKLK